MKREKLLIETDLQVRIPTILRSGRKTDPLQHFLHMFVLSSNSNTTSHILVRSPKQGPTFRILPAAHTLCLAMLDRRPTRLVKWNRERLGARRWRAFVLGFRAIKEYQGPSSLRKARDTHARPLRSLMLSSHASCSHQGMTAIHLLSSVGTKSSQRVTSFMCALYSVRAFAYMSL